MATVSVRSLAGAAGAAGAAAGGAGTGPCLASTVAASSSSRTRCSSSASRRRSRCSSSSLPAAAAAGKAAGAAGAAAAALPAPLAPRCKQSQDGVSKHGQSRATAAATKSRQDARQAAQAKTTASYGRSRRTSTLPAGVCLQSLLSFGPPVSAVGLTLADSWLRFILRFDLALGPLSH